MLDGVRELAGRDHELGVTGRVVLGRGLELSVHIWLLFYDRTPIEVIRVSEYHWLLFILRGIRVINLN